jgi:hypothetical protein
MVALPFHTSHAFQPLNVSYFKPFKIAFKKERNAIMATSKFNELDNITLAR